MSRTFLGDFEQMVLLRILRMVPEHMGPRSVRNSKWPPTGRSRGGGFYTTLDRMERKG